VARLESNLYQRRLVMTHSIPDMYFDQQHSLWRGVAILSFAGFGSLG
jgi:hypothetical protein